MASRSRISSTPRTRSLLGLGVGGLAAVAVFGQLGGTAAVPVGGTIGATGVVQPSTMGVAATAPLQGGLALPQQPVVAPPVTNPAVTNPAVTNPAVTNPAVTNPALTNPAAAQVLRDVQADLATTQQIMNSVATLNGAQTAQGAQTVGAQAGGAAQTTPAVCTQGVVGVLQPVQAELQADIAKLDQLAVQAATDPVGFAGGLLGDAVGLVQKELGEVGAILGGCQQAGAAGQQVAALPGQQAASAAAQNLTLEQVQRQLADQVAKLQQQP